MALKRIKAKMTAVPLIKDGIPTIEIDGDMVQQYNDADTAKKTAEKLMAELRPDLIELGVGDIIQRNCASPVKPITTVRLSDDKGEAIQVQFTSSYSAANAEAVEKVFEELTGDEDAINNYVQETVVGTWSEKAFQDGNGQFDRKKFDRYKKAVEQVAKELGDECPLATQKKVLPLANFHLTRWSVFPSVAHQVKLSLVLPNTVRLVPVRAKNTDKKDGS